MGRGEPCINLSPIEFLLQYRFATPKPLKACPGLEGCRTAPLRNRVLVDSLPPRCSSPLSLLNPASPQARPGAVQGAKRGEADPLTARTRPYNPALRERWVEGRTAAAGPPSIRALDSLIPGFFVSTGVVAPTTCSLTTCLTICKGVPKARRIAGGGGPESAKNCPGGGPESAWKTLSNHGCLWITLVAAIT